MNAFIKEKYIEWLNSMNLIWIIFKKDFKQIFLSPLFFISVGFICIFLSYVFPRDLFQFASTYHLPNMQMGMSQSKNIHFDVFISHISYISLFILFFAPVFTMRLITEEKKNRTFDLLMTAPISSLHIVIGKYLALLSCLFAFLFITFIYPLSTFVFTDFSFTPLLTSYLGLFLLVSVYGAIGMFSASLTKSSVLSVIIGIILNISIWFISEGRDFSNNEIFVAVMDYLSVGVQFTTFIKGSISIVSVVFFLNMITFFIFLAYKTIEFMRWRP